MVKEFEIHLASDVISSGLANRLLSLGYVRDAFIGGTAGVVHPCHFTADPQSRSESHELWRRSIAALKNTSSGEFYGYAEAEITPPGCRIELPWKNFDERLPFPFARLQYEPCPVDQHKDFDIHVTANLATIDSRLRRILEDEINFHFVDIRKPLGKIVRVYTFQPLGVKPAKGLFDALVEYFTTVGGLDGKIKLEMCSNFARFPAECNCVPPIVREIELRDNAVSNRRAPAIENARYFGSR